MGTEWANLVAEAARSHGGAPSGIPEALLLPWERGVAGAVLGGAMGLNRLFAPAVFSDLPPPPPLPVPPLELPRLQPGPREFNAPRAATIPRMAARTTFGRVRRKLKCTKPKESDKNRRERVVQAWVGIGLCAPAGELYRQTGGNALEMSKSLRLIFTGKATSTLAKRASSISSFRRWHASMDLPGPAIPPREEVLFRHLAEMYDEGGAPTRAQALLEALNLACATFGLPADAQLSARVKGAASASFAQKRGTLQRPPLSVTAMRILEDGVTNANTLCDRVFCGFAAFCAHSRMRFLDAARVRVEPTIDEAGPVAFIEASSTEHKGANKPRVRGLTLPVVGHAIGIRGEPWAEAWLEVRRTMNLSADNDGALMLTPSGGDSFISRRLSTTEGAIWLREVLIDGGLPPEEAAAYGTHSLKSTLLSWAAKAGMPKGARRLLGGHAAQRDRSVLEYSRDALAEPLRLMGEVLDKIAVGEFLPDATRSGRWKGLSQARLTPHPSTPCPPSPTVPAASSSDETGNTSDSSAGESSQKSTSEAGEVAAMEAQDERADCEISVSSSGSDTDDEAESDADPEELPEGGLVQHVRYLTLHCRSVGDAEKLVCGRTMGHRYRDLEQWPAAAWNRCKGCFV